MSPNTSPGTKKIVLGLVIVAAILMIAVIPFIAFKMVNPMVNARLAPQTAHHPRPGHRRRNRRELGRGCGVRCGTGHHNG